MRYRWTISRFLVAWVREHCKIVEEYWTMSATRHYDAVVTIEAPDDETMSAFILKVGSLGNVKG